MSFAGEQSTSPPNVTSSTGPRFAHVAERTYTSADLTKLTGATYKMIDHWCRAKGLIPEATPGSGKARHFTAADLDAVYAAVALIRFGMTIDAALPVARELVATDQFSAVLGEVFCLSITVRATSDPVAKPEADPTERDQP